MTKLVSGSEYKLIEELHLGFRYRVTLASNPEGEQLVLKQALDLNADPQILARLRQEFYLSEQLRGPRFVRALGLEMLEGRLTLTLQAFNGQSLDRLYEGQALERGLFLSIARQTAEALEALHQLRLLYRNLEMGHVLYHPQSDQLKLIGLCKAAEPEQFEGPLEAPMGDPALIYHSPELLGLIPRSLDLRSDLYALGVLLYRLLLGQCPFAGLEGIEVMYSKTGNPPPPPIQRFPQTDPQLSAVVDRLIKIDPNERYQSCKGLLADLSALEAGESFQIGAADRPVQLHFPEPAHIQRKSRRDLVHRLERGVGKPGQLIWIEGSTGRSMERFVESLAPVIRQRGWLLIHDELNHGGLAAILGRGLSAWLRQLLWEPDQQIQTWRRLILEQMGPVPQVLVDFAPEIRHLAPVAPGATTGLASALSQLLRLMTQQYGLVVLSLGDLQWLQDPDLPLLESLLEQLPTSAALLATHDSGPAATRLFQRLSTFVKADYQRLEPLDSAQTQRWTEQTLGTPPDQTVPLAKLLWETSQGNPLLLQQILQSLQESGLLQHKPGSGWLWDLELVSQQLQTEGIPLLIERRLEALDPQLRQLLQQIAIMGDPVDLDLLRDLSLLPKPLLRRLLGQAEAMGLMLSYSNSFRFVHPEIRRLLIQQMPTEQAAETHLALAVVLRHRQPRFLHSPLLFEITEHYNHARHLLVFPGERLELARLDLAAGEWAEQAGLLEAAVEAYQAGQLALKDLLEPTTNELAEAVAGNFELAWREIWVLLRLRRMPQAEKQINLLGPGSTEVQEIRIALLALVWAQEMGLTTAVQQALQRGFKALGMDPTEPTPQLTQDNEVQRWAKRFLSEALLTLLSEPGDAALWAAQLILRLGKNQPPGEGQALAQMLLAAQAAQLGQEPQTEVYTLGAKKMADQWGQPRAQLRIELIEWALVRPWTKPFNQCAQELWPRIEQAIALGDQAWAVRGLLWYYALVFEGPRGPLRAAESLKEAQRLAQGQLKAVPKGFESGFLANERSDDPFRGPLFEALTHFLVEQPERAVKALYHAQQNQPALVEPPYIALMAFLQGQLGQSEGQSQLQALAQQFPLNFGEISRQLELTKSLKASSEVGPLEALEESLSRSGRLFYEMLLVEAYAHLSWKQNKPRKARGLYFALLDAARNWGAEVKIREVRHQFAKYFPDHQLPPAPEKSAPEENPRGGLLSALTTIAKEIDPERLMPAMLQIIMEQAGAEKGLLFFIENGQPRLAADLCSVGGQLISEDQSYSAAVLRYVLHTGEDVVLDDALNRGPFIIDHYVQNHQVHSLLAAPFTSGDEVTGVLYLENNRIEAAFGATQMEQLRVLLGQAKISWENARLYRRQQELVEQLKDMDRLKDEFLANTSHELRTPLAGIIGMAEMMAQGGAKGDDQERLQLIIQSGKRLTGLINDILDFSLLKERRLKLQLAPIHLPSLAENILTLCRPLAGKRPVELVNLVPAQLEAVAADENRLQQILYNLVGNAIKFTPKGKVEIRAERQGDQIIVEVADQGIGIEPDQMHNLFELFERGQGRPDSEGTGLGLALTSQLVRLHKGQLEVESKPAEGSLFRFNLPVHQGKAQPLARIVSAQIAPEPTEAPRRSDARGLVLVVEDDLILQRTLSQYLVRSGYDCLSAIDGREALEIIELEPKIDLILLDLMLPEVSGFEVCRQLRQFKGREELPVILLTARAGGDDILEGFNAGANDYLIKPVQAAEMLARVEAQIEVSRSLERKRQNRRLHAEVERRRQVERQLQARQRGLLRFFDQTESPVFALDQKFRLTLANRRAETLMEDPSAPQLMQQLERALKDPQAPQQLTLNPSEPPWALSFEPLAEEQGWLVSLRPPGKSSGELAHLGGLSTLLGHDGASMLREVRNLPPRLDDADLPSVQSKREAMVEIMNLSLRYWSQTTSKGKVEFAEESAIWNSTVDKNGTYRTRTLDRYLKLSKFPANPRWRDVLQTAFYVLQHCPPEAPELFEELSQKLRNLETFLRKD
ncbi:MAG: ATP-binding protein [bacterium]|nr:ATP-binding protein [bacterium]